MCMTRKGAQIQLEQMLEPVSSSYKAEARQIMQFVLGRSMLELMLDRDAVLSEEEWARIQQIADRRSFHEPLQYILGQQGFMGQVFTVTPDVLIPRPETEMMVTWILEKADKNRPLRILDIGTGSGAIAISLARALPNANVWGTDISLEALEVAKKNAVQHHVSDRTKWYVGDLFEAIPPEAAFDLIVSNPPYIPETERPSLQREVQFFEPETALFGGVDGLDFYRRMIPDAKRHLVAGGVLVFEAGYNQAGQVEALFETSQYKTVGHFEDLCGISRFIYGILEEN